MNRPSEQRCSHVVALGDEVRIHVEGHAGAAMAKATRDGADINAAGDELRGREVAGRLMERQALEADVDRSRLNRRVTTGWWHGSIPSGLGEKTNGPCAGAPHRWAVASTCSR